MSGLFIKNYREALIKNDLISLPGFENGALRVIKNDKNLPVCFSGSSSVVFKLTDGEKDFAFKCFITELQGRWPFLEMVKQKLEEIKNNRIVSFGIFKDALAVEDDQNALCMKSVILMPWIEGETLQERVRLYCTNNNAEGIRKLWLSFIDLAVSQQGQPYSHGDINPANIMVKPDGKMILVDHDTFRFEDTINRPGLAGWGLGYQHPLRHPDHVDIHVDDFPFLLIAISLKALEHDPGLFHRFNTSRGMLFTIDDLKRPWNSKAFAEIGKTDDPYLKRLMHVLQLSLLKPTVEIPGLVQYLSGNISIEQQNELNEAVQILNEKNQQRVTFIPEKKKISTPLPVDKDIPPLTPGVFPEKSLVDNSPAVHTKRRYFIRIGIFTALLTITTIVLCVKYYLPGNALVMPVNYKEFVKSRKVEKDDFTNKLIMAQRSLIHDSNAVHVDNSIIADTMNSIGKLKPGSPGATEEKADATITGTEKKPESTLKPTVIKPVKKRSVHKPKRVYDVEFRKIDF